MVILATWTFLLLDEIFDPRYNELKKLVEETSDLLGIERYDSKIKVTDVWGGGSVSVGNIDFLYQKVEELYNQFEKIYEEEKRPAGVAFKKFMEENKEMEEVERIKKARRAAAVELLNSDWFKKGYISKYLNRDSEGYYISPEAIMHVLGEDYFTLEDFYAAETYWVRVCDSGRTTDFTDCQAFWGRYEANYCPNLRENWTTCARLYEIATVEKNCKACKDGVCSEHPKRRLTSNEDAKAYEKCCDNISYSPLSGTTKEEEKIIKENENLTKEDLINRHESIAEWQRLVEQTEEKLKQPDLSDDRKETLSIIYEDQKFSLERTKRTLENKTREELIREKFKKRENPFVGE